jgi:hypothetical protein
VLFIIVKLHRAFSDAVPVAEVIWHLLILVRMSSDNGEVNVRGYNRPKQWEETFSQGHIYKEILPEGDAIIVLSAKCNFRS